MIERAFVTLSEGQMHLRRIAGTAPQCRPLLLLHASPVSSAVLQGLMRALVEAGHRGALVAPDTLGNGDSAAPAGEQPDIAYFADSKRRLVDALGYERVDIYGGHTGARIACEFAAAFPDRVGRVILDGIMEYDEAMQRLVVERYAPRVAPDEYGRQFIWAFNFVRDQAHYFPYFMRDAEHRLAGAVPDPATLHRATLDVLKALDTYSKPYIAAFQYPAYSRMQQVRAPVLLLRPDAELPVLNAAIDTAMSRLPRAQVARVAPGDAAKAAAIAAFLREENA
jgi:pimeloyl-ACP methyl ester carboxylesterase